MSTIVLFEDRLVRGLEPLTLTRPVFELVAGALSQRERIERLSGQAVGHASVRPRIVSWCREAGMEDFLAAPPPAPWLFVNGRFLPDAQAWRVVSGLETGQVLAAREELLAFRLDSNPVRAAVLARGEWGREGPRAGALAASKGADDWRSPFLEAREDPADLILLESFLSHRRTFRRGSGPPSGGTPNLASSGCILRHSSDLIACQERLLEADLDALTASGEGVTRLKNAPGEGLHVQGDRVFMGAGARISAPAVFDSRSGPILIGSQAQVGPFTVLEGPMHLSGGTQVLGGRLAASHIGPGCRIRGEVASSVFLGWTNKAHEGFVGHSYFGEWVNLGALTTTSNLKNTYGEIRVGIGSRQRTGLQKLGSIVGDHTRTAIGSLLATGSLIGMGVNLHGATGLAPGWLPSFLWGVGKKARPYDLERFLTVAERVLARRGKTLGPEERERLIDAYRVTAAEREAYLADASR